MDNGEDPDPEEVTSGIGEKHHRKRLRARKTTSAYEECSSDSEDYTYKPRYKPYKALRLEKQKRPKQQFKEGLYAITRKGFWGTHLNIMIFRFDPNGSGVQSRCVSEEQECSYNRFPEEINELSVRPIMGPPPTHASVGVKPGSDEYLSYICIMAMRHIEECLEQGNQNEKCKQESKRSSMSSASSLQSEETFESQESTAKWKIGPSKVCGFVSSPIDPRDVFFLHPALTCLNPQQPSEPFLLFRVSVKCVELKHIFSVENCGAQFQEDVDVNEAATEVLSFLAQKSISLEKQKPDESGKSDHFLHAFISSICEYQKTNSEKWNEHLTELEKICPTAEHLFDLLSEFQTTFMLSKEGETEKMTEHHLRRFTRRILDLDGSADFPSAKYLKQFNKQPKLEDPTSTPDVVYTINRTRAKRNMQLAIIAKLKKLKETVYMQNIIVNGKVESVEMQTVLMWQVFEKLLATLLERSIKTEKPVVYQGGLIVVGGKVRTVVLAMCTEIHKVMRKFNDVKETLDFIKKSQTPWCRLYMEKSEHSMWDIIERAKITHINFSECISI